MNRSFQTRSQISFTLSDFFWAAVLAAILGFSAAVATAQSIKDGIAIDNVIGQSTCPTLRVTGAIANCQGSSVLWASSTPNVRGYYLETYFGRWPAGQSLLPSSQRAFLIPSGCSTGGAVRLIEVLNSGGQCTLDWSGNLPHARNCADTSCAGAAGVGATTVHAANFRQGLAPNAIAAVFPDAGQSFTDQTAFATGFPLPTVLGGVSITMNGVQCELLSVTPGQINFHIPSDADPGPTDIPVQILTTRGSAPQFLSRAQTNPSAPGIFTLASNGTGPAASNWLIVKPNGLQIWQNAGSLSFNSADRIFLVLYGTGINEIESALIVNGLTISAIYTGPSWMTGVQQMTFPLTTAQASALPAMSGAFVRVGIPGRSWDSQGFDVRR